MLGGSSYPVTQQSYDTSTVPLVLNGPSEAHKTLQQRERRFGHGHCVLTDVSGSQM
jgi:hypothetical protein